MSEPRYYVHDRKVSPLQKFTAVNTRYWVMDRENPGQIVDEFTTKRPAAATAADLNRSAK